MEQAQLTFTDPTGQRQTVLVSETPFRIGRSRGNNLPVTGAEVSREHAEIAWDGDRFVVRDRASRAGTFVNDDLVESQPLKAGDRIRVGSLEFVFSMGLRRDDDTQSTGSSTAISDLRQTAALLAGLRAVGTACAGSRA